MPVSRSIQSAHRTEPRLAVVADAGVSTGRTTAEAMARRLGLPVIEADAADYDFLLVHAGGRLELHDARQPRSRPIFVDFVGGATGFRRRSGPTRNEPLAKALGLGRGTQTVLDATAGLARDAFVLASLGCVVTCVERNPALAALIEDGLRRAAAEGSGALGACVGRMTLHWADARDVLRGLATPLNRGVRPHAVYLDPMYPPRSKSALAKKEMRVCRALVGDDADAGELLELARTVATRRVAVKRHRLAPPLAGSPDFQLVTKQVRFDVYVTPNAG